MRHPSKNRECEAVFKAGRGAAGGGHHPHQPMSTVSAERAELKRERAAAAVRRAARASERAEAAAARAAARAPKRQRTLHEVEVVVEAVAPAPAPAPTRLGIRTGRNPPNESGAGVGWEETAPVHGQPCTCEELLKAARLARAIHETEVYAVHELLIEHAAGAAGIPVVPGRCTARSTSTDVDAGPDAGEVRVLERAGLLPACVSGDAAWTGWTSFMVSHLPASLALDAATATALRGVLSDLNLRVPPPCARVVRVDACVQCE